MRAYLFDMDGTVIDSDPLHARVFVDFLAARGMEISVEDYNREFHGRQNGEIFAELFPDEDAHALDLAKEAAYRELLAVTDITPPPGLLPLIAQARSHGIATAIVTNASRANADAVIAKFDIAALFDTVVLAEDVARGKPDPAVYLTALDRLGIEPDAAVAFEDSPPGIAAARAAGLPVVGLATTLSPERLTELGTVHAIHDFTDPALLHWLDGTHPQGAQA